MGTTLQDTYSTVLYNIGFSEYSNTDLNWYQYVMDHLLILRSTSLFLYPTEELMNQYKYLPELFVFRYTTSYDLLWIFLAINELKSEMDFVYEKVQNGLYVPPRANVDALYQSYQSTSMERITYPVGQGIEGPIYYPDTSISGLHNG